MSSNPYESPKHTDELATSCSVFDRVSAAIIVAALLYTLMYVPYFGFLLFRSINGAELSPWMIFPAHAAGMLLNFAALVMTIRDLYLRPFPNPNTKLTWLLLIFMTGGIGWIIYIFKHALRPRPMAPAA